MLLLCPHLFFFLVGGQWFFLSPVSLVILSPLFTTSSVFFLCVSIFFVFPHLVLLCLLSQVFSHLVLLSQVFFVSLSPDSAIHSNFFCNFVTCILVVSVFCHKFSCFFLTWFFLSQVFSHLVLFVTSFLRFFLTWFCNT